MTTSPTSETSISTKPDRRPRHKVQTLAGGEIELLHRQEKTYYNDAKTKYLSEYTFTIANDLRSLDRLLLLEVSMYRAQWFLAAGMDYDAVDLDGKEEIALQRLVKETGNQIHELQASLGLDKAQRDKAQHDSVGAYITQLKAAAKLHGVKREKEMGRAIELAKELFALCGAYTRSNEEERRKLGLEKPDDIIAWVTDYMQPEYDRIDEHFRTTEQKFWVRSL